MLLFQMYFLRKVKNSEIETSGFGKLHLCSFWYCVTMMEIDIDFISILSKKNVYCGRFAYSSD